jgi:N-acetylglucosamine-6-phosphate deacetylase
MNNTTYLSAHKIYTGKRWYEDSTLVIENEIITAIVPNNSITNQPITIYPYIIPALIDLQIYGAGGQLLSVFPKKDSLFLLQDYCTKGGAKWFQPTVATNSNQVIHACIDAVKDYQSSGGKGCIGLHVEGPWINNTKRGAHLTEFIHVPSINEVKDLLEYGKGIVTMITLAPEICNKEIVDLIHAYGVVVSAGHSDANYEVATKAFNEGIKTATHLFNAMSPLQHRAPGMVGAIFNHPTVMCSIVPDGYHVDFEAIKIAKKQMGNRLFVITDAVTNTSEGPYPHQLNGDKYEANGILSGSALTMLKSIQNLVNQVGIELGEAINMCSLYPAQIMGMKHITGFLEPGNPADFICVNKELELLITHDN